MGILSEGLGFEVALGDPGVHLEVREGNLGPLGVRAGSSGALTGLSGAQGMMGVVGTGIIELNSAAEHHGSCRHSCDVSRRAQGMTGDEVTAQIALYRNRGA